MHVDQYRAIELRCRVDGVRCRSTCMTRVLEGVPDHKDQYLTPEEQATNDQFLPCCSCAKTPLLVLDLRLGKSAFRPEEVKKSLP